MHRAAALALIASITSGCTLALPNPDFPGIVPPQHRSLKDDPVPVIKPQIEPAKLTTYLGISPRILVVGDTTHPTIKYSLARALFHELNLRGHIKTHGNYSVIGAVEGDTVRWRIKDPDGKTIADIDQQGLTDAAVAAIVAGVTSYLRPPALGASQ